MVLGQELELGLVRVLDQQLGMVLVLELRAPLVLVLHFQNHLMEDRRLELVLELEERQLELEPLVVEELRLALVLEEALDES